MGTNAREYLSKVPFKEKVNEYTSKASNLFKRTPAPTAAPAPVAPLAQPGLPAALEARAKAGTGTAAPSAPARTLRVKARAGEMARTVTAPAPAPAPKPGGMSGTKPGIGPKVKPGIRSKVMSGGVSGKSFRPGRTTSLASRMAGRANMLGMALGLILDLLPSNEAEELDRDAWKAAKALGINRDDVTRDVVDQYRKMQQVLKEGGKVNKLDYINKLNGECPEGYTAVKFAKGGVICTTCQKNKEVAAKKKNHLDAIKEEMKCGGKMKSHQNGGEMTNSQYKKAPLSKKVDQDLKDQATGKNAGEGGTPKTDLTKVAPKKLIKKPTKK